MSFLCESQKTITIFEILFAKIIYIFHFRENHRCFTYFRDSSNSFMSWKIFSPVPNPLLKLIPPFFLASLNAFHTLWESRIYFLLSPFTFPFFLYSIALWYSPFNQGVANIQNPLHFGLQASNFFIGKDELAGFVKLPEISFAYNMLLLKKRCTVYNVQCVHSTHLIL